MSKSALLGMAAAAVLAAGTAFAHAKLTASEPAGNAQLMKAPAALKLTFDEAVQLAVLKLVSAGVATPLTLDRTAQASTTVTVALPALAPGKYAVQWTALSADDGHVTKGTFSFTVADAMTMSAR